MQLKHRAWWGVGGEQVGSRQGGQGLDHAELQAVPQGIHFIL